MSRFECYTHVENPHGSTAYDVLLQQQLRWAFRILYDVFSLDNFIKLIENSN